MTEVDLFDYELPDELIAALPAERRDQSRLLALERAGGVAAHRRFYELPELLRDDDLLVMNDARVIPARLQARRKSGGRIELLLVRPLQDGDQDCDHWLAMTRGAQRLQPGEALSIENTELEVVVEAKRQDGYVTLSFGGLGARQLMEHGAMPLPPYIEKARDARGMPRRIPQVDRERYQTVFADRPGAVAAPTAGLHFTKEMLEVIHRRGVEVRMLTLMVGPGTFRPVRDERIEDHNLEAEMFHLPGETAGAVDRALADGRRIVATGTTTCRVLEYVARERAWREQTGWTDLYIYPPFEFRVVGALITNFHLPRSTLLMLVSAFAGRENILRAYRLAVERRYRFYSYGDAMFIH